jgi:hypothetical protein
MDEPRDIGLLIKEVPQDILNEADEDIRAALMEWAWPKIRRGICAGLPEWYKQQLLAKQFSDEAGAASEAAQAQEAEQRFEAEMVPA